MGKGKEPGSTRRGHNPQRWRDEEGPGGGGSVWLLAEGTALSLLGSLRPSGLAGRGQSAAPLRSGTWTWRQEVHGDRKLVLQVFWKRVWPTEERNTSIRLKAGIAHKQGKVGIL